jgi:hypothetical protein
LFFTVTRHGGRERERERERLKRKGMKNVSVVLTRQQRLSCCREEKQ